MSLKCKVVQGILQQLLHDMTTVSNQADEALLVQSKLINLVTDIQGFDSKLDRHLTVLKSVNANPIANYYWLLFVAIYVISLPPSPTPLPCENGCV